MLRGVIVRLATGSGPHSGTDDPLYVGISGSAGGREFPLDVRGFDDFERRSRVTYLLGEVWEEEARIRTRTPHEARGGWNDPSLFGIGFDAIDRVYLRKQSGRVAVTDDAYELDEIEVALYADAGRKRLFRCTNGIWLGMAYGCQVWLTEVDPASLSVSMRL